jgi:histidyl-tRNA synthetase
VSLRAFADVSEPLHINTLGTSSSRAAYTHRLRNYLEAYRNDLSSDSRARLERGSVLRILDSNDATDQAIVHDSNCPRLLSYLDTSDRTRLDYILQALEAQEIAYVVDERLVRGLDYYDHTIFEFIVETPSNRLAHHHAFKPQAVLAGGRYNGLSAQMGGPDIGAIGYATWHNAISGRQSDTLPWPILTLTFTLTLVHVMALVGLLELNDSCCISMTNTTPTHHHTN